MDIDRLGRGYEGIDAVGHLLVRIKNGVLAEIEIVVADVIIDEVIVPDRLGKNPMPFQRVGKSLGRGNGLQVDAGIHQGEEFHFIEEMQGVPRIDALAAMEELLIPACQHDVMVTIPDARIVKNGKSFVLPADAR